MSVVYYNRFSFQYTRNNELIKLDTNSAI